MSTIKVQNIQHTGSSTNAISLASDGTATANLTNIGGGQLGNRNLIINGAMQVAQRGTSSTTSGYATVDRFAVQYGGTDEAPTQAQVDVAAGTSPYTNGFRKAYKITNGNQTSGAGAADFVRYRIRIENQDIANSGWNYTSSSSSITLSFWVKSSVAQNFYGHLLTLEGTQQGYPFETGSLTADTWTKITKTIPGNSNLTFANNNTLGLEVSIYGFLGTDFTASGVTENAWNAWSSSTYTEDQTSTWYTTNNATLEITGVQLEVGTVATDFEHRSFAQELLLCQRYYYRTTPLNLGFFGVGNVDGSNQSQILITFPTEMRSKPTSVETSGTAAQYALRVSTNATCSSVPAIGNTTTVNAICEFNSTSHGFTSGQAAFGRSLSDAAFLGFAGAEL